VTLCVNPGGQLTFAAPDGCRANTTAVQVATEAGLTGVAADLAAADGALTDRLDAVESTSTV
jgi:hypothetical protein